TRLLHAEETLALNDHAVAVAALARCRLRAAAAAAPRALGARLFTRNVAALGRAAVRFGQIHLDRDLQVASRRRPAPAAALTEDVAEQVAKQVEDRFGAVEMRDVHAVQAGVSVAVVALALVRLAQDLVRLGRFLELLLGLRVADVAVWVILHGQLAV